MAHNNVTMQNKECTHKLTIITNNNEILVNHKTCTKTKFCYSFFHNTFLYVHKSNVNPTALNLIQMQIKLRFSNSNDFINFGLII
jgi:hypothetical protein